MAPTAPQLGLPQLSPECRACLTTAVDGGGIVSADDEAVMELRDLGLVQVMSWAGTDIRFTATAQGRAVAVALGLVTGSSVPPLPPRRRPQPSRSASNARRYRRR